MVKQFNTEKVEQFLNTFYPRWFEFSIKLFDGVIVAYQVMHRSIFDGTISITLLCPSEIDDLDLDLTPENKQGSKVLTISK